MAGYTIHFLRSDGSFADSEDFEADDDIAALVLGNSLLDLYAERYVGYELWTYGRLVIRTPEQWKRTRQRSDDQLAANAVR